MDETIKAMIESLDKYGAGYVSVKIGKYTIILTDDEDGAEYLSEAWERYVYGCDN